MKAVILAGGLGTRISEETCWRCGGSSIPKGMRERFGLRDLIHPSSVDGADKRVHPEGKREWGEGVVPYWLNTLPHTAAMQLLGHCHDNCRGPTT